MDDETSRGLSAIDRYLVISAYLAQDPPRGRRRQMLKDLAGKT